ncbi:MAG: PhzF family phenazine biosynthesis protein [Alphaproteobacteria bacterium]|jgi:PhzF family phenazine biosynthesis protein
MELRIWKLDAFAEKLFEGNPAAVIPLEAWLPDDQMLAIAAENNLSETAFLVPATPGNFARCHLRWFTPEVEVSLCGHATLATAHVVLTHLAPALDTVTFATKSGDLAVSRGHAGLLEMALPAYQAAPHPQAEEFIEALEEALDVAPREILKANYPIAIFETVDEILEAEADSTLAETLDEFGETGIMITAAGGDTGFDFVSRFFAPGKGIAEDPVTGSAHAALAPLWARRLGKPRLKARQLSARGGTVDCEEQGERVLMRGRVTPYLEGIIRI